MDETTDAPFASTNDGLVALVGDLRADGSRGLARQLEDTLRAAVRDGRLAPDLALPSTRELAGDLGVSRGVVVRAFEQLAAEGYLVARVGRGTRVATLLATAEHPPPTHRRFEPANPGVPDLGWFPRPAWSRATQQALTEVASAELGYGDPRGHPQLRAALRDHLARTRAVHTSADGVVVTGGFAQAIRLAAEVLAAHGITTVGIEDPGSVGSSVTLEAGGVTAVPIPVDDAGLDVTALAATDLRAVVVTPAHQFPTGAVLAPHRRADLLTWAHERDGLIIEDDYDAEYRYDRAPIGCLQGLAPDVVLHGGSVSKVLAPGLRLGWMIVPDELIESVARHKFLHDIAAPVLDQLALANLIESGDLHRHVRRTSKGYARRRRALLAAVEHHLPGWRVEGIAAGLHAVLVPPNGTDVDPLTAAARELGAVPLGRYQRNGPPRPGLVVGYGHRPSNRIEHVIQRLADS